MHNMENPTKHSLKRAVTTSFGTICFGSLLIAVIKTLRYLSQQSNNNRNGGALALVACIITCILRCLENIIEYFNTYAFCQVAIYGQPFCEAAKATWKLMKEKGIDAIVNDSIIGSLLSFSCLIGGLLSAGFGFLICYLFSPSSLLFPIIAAVIGLFMGFFIMSIVLQVIDSGVVTIFVCFSLEPRALNANAPELYNKLRETYGASYPQIGW